VADSPDIWVALKRIDELRKEITEYREQTVERLSELKTMILEKEGAMEKDISKLERESMKEGFGIREQVTAIAWRVGLIVSVALGIIAFVARDLHMSDLFGARTEAKRKP